MNFIHRIILTIFITTITPPAFSQKPSAPAITQSTEALTKSEQHRFELLPAQWDIETAGLPL